ncbi:MAG TPA: NAD-dependent epimerase/dehydratase family protein [Thermoanaerobaculia bacterium]|jgi:UDP-glucose 4-epimerase|nr:NAD-dependent epimerase/dehydratase family protein [Thermoanaerobaculia bacterium]
MARVLLTGATGFLGRALLRRLLERGDEVAVLGRSEPRDAGSWTFLEADLGEPETVLRHRQALSGIELVAHLGGWVLRSSDPAADEMAGPFRVNAEGTAHLLSILPPDLAAFCYASTLDVYGPPEEIPLREDHPLRPATFYGASKAAAEGLLGVWSRRRGVPASALRFTQVYGPGDTSGKAIPNFLRACLAGEAPPVRGSGEDARDYLYVDDAVAAILAALDRRAAGAFNVASGSGVSMRDLLATIQRLTGCTGEPGWAPSQSSRPPSRIVLDVGKARAGLGWRPEVGLEEGLGRAVAWIRTCA